MKKLFIFSLAVALLMVATGSAFARVGDSRVGYQRRETAMIFNVPTGHVHITTSPADVWRVTMTAEAVTTFLQLYDSAGTASASTMAAHCSSLLGVVGPASLNKSDDLISFNVKADINVSTAADPEIFNFDPPLHFKYGILAGFIDLSADLAGQDVTHAIIEWTPAPVE